MNGRTNAKEDEGGKRMSGNRRTIIEHSREREKEARREGEVDDEGGRGMEEGKW